jgi:general stress protein YciG
LQEENVGATLLFGMAKKTMKDPAAVSLGRKGGKARLTKLTQKERSDIARKGGLAGGRGRKKES